MSNRKGDEDRCGLEPRAAARRRLMRAVGGSGFALGAILAAKWHKPVVQSVLLPAHAQVSPAQEDSEPSVPCPVSVTIAGGPDGGARGSYTLDVQIGGTTLAEISTAGATLVSTSTSAGTTLPVGTFQIAGRIAVGRVGVFTALLSASCCDASASQTFGSTTTAAGSFESLIDGQITDDGECTLSPL